MAATDSQGRGRKRESYSDSCVSQPAPMEDIDISVAMSLDLSMDGSVDMDKGTEDNGDSVVVEGDKMQIDSQSRPSQLKRNNNKKKDEGCSSGSGSSRDTRSSDGSPSLQPASSTSDISDGSFSFLTDRAYVNEPEEQGGSFGALTSSRGHMHCFPMMPDDQEKPWFFHKCSRGLADRLLEGSKPGTFLIRPSSQPSCYAISWVEGASHASGEGTCNDQVHTPEKPDKSVMVESENVGEHDNGSDTKMKTDKTGLIASPGEGERRPGSPNATAGGEDKEGSSEKNVIRHQLVFEMFPGYSLSKTVLDRAEGWFCDLSSLVESCEFLVHACPPASEDQASSRHQSENSKTSSQVVNHIGKLMGENCATLVSVDWFFTLRDTGLDVTASQREYRTETRYSNVQYSAPELLPLSSLHASILSRALTENITVLDLRICGTSGSFYRNFTAVMGDEQAAYLAVGIEASKSLRSVVLSYNRITDFGAVHLARAVAYNSSLQQLDLTNNFVHDVGIHHLTWAFQQCSRFTKYAIDNQLMQHQSRGGIVRPYLSKFIQTMAMHGVPMALLRRNELLHDPKSIGFEGFMSQAHVEKVLLQEYSLRSKSEGTFGGNSKLPILFYLNRKHCCLVMLARISLRSGVAKVRHEPILRTKSGYAIRMKDHNNGNPGSSRLKIRSSVDIYVPTLFQMCSWQICGTPDLLRQAEAVLGHSILASMRDVGHTLFPMWQILRDLPPPSQLREDVLSAGFEGIRAVQFVTLETRKGTGFMMCKTLREIRSRIERRVENSSH